jgi:hypothetical protein
MLKIRMPVAAGAARRMIHRSTGRAKVFLVVTLALAGSSLSGCASGTLDRTSSASCAAVVVYQGQTYWGRGGVVRDPATTGRLVKADVPPCDDTGGQLPADPAARVDVAELAGVPLTTGFLFHDTVYLRRGHQLPRGTRVWFQAQRCSSPGAFRLTGDWLGVTGSRTPRFDGDLPLPYQLAVHATGGPRRYVGATIDLRADTTTRPALRAADVKASLWKGGQLDATVSCMNGRFRALALRASPTR